MINPYVSDWLNLLLRWFHIIVGAAWIGTSFYFNWLNNHVRPSDDGDPEVAGDLWSVHGGAFYQVRKIAGAPKKLPETLHWFMWEAYFTWISGIALLTLVYYFGAKTYMVGPSGTPPELAVLAGILSILIGWFAYDWICKTAIIEHPEFFVTICFAYVTLDAWLLCQILSPRAAYIHVGAMLGTCMAANVFFVIIPGQRRMVDAMTKGEKPNPADGQAGSLRSLHNNYMTLPVLLIMVSNHYPITYGHSWNWAILAAISLIGAVVRHWFNLRGKGHYNAWILPVAVAAIFALAVVSAPRRAEAPQDSRTIGFSEVRELIDQRCVPCHAENPEHPTVIAPPKNIVLTSDEEIVKQAALIRAQTVDSHTMPLANLTAMTDDERALLGTWIDQGARIQ